MTIKAVKSSCSLLLVLLLLLVAGCGNQYEAEVGENYQMVKERLGGLKKDLQRRTLSNARIVDQYAKKLASSNREMADIAATLRKDSTPDGTLFKSLQSRLNAVRLSPKDEPEYRATLAELNNLWVASDTAVFNDALLDIINTMADLSQGELARINIPRAEQGEQLIPGSQLVGNPAYGQWQTNSSGQSFWAWYGQYALISSLLNGVGGYQRGPIFQRDWASGSRYSYYNDYGRSSYGTAKDRKTAPKTVRPKRSYGSTTGQKRRSTYMRNRGTSGKPVGLGTTAKRASSFSSFSSSSRGTSSGSRGLRGGK